MEKNSKVETTSVQLSKTSNEADLKNYFSAILALKNSNKEFPVNLDDVWMLVYSRKDKAVRALLEDGQFVQDIDYQVFHQNGENPKGGRPTIEYYLSVSCLEYFIVRKVRLVFEVYRQVFHKVAESYTVPQTFGEALMLAAKQQLQIEEQQKQLTEQEPKVNFANAMLVSSTSCLVGELAKVLTQNGYEIGQNRLFKWLRDNNYLGKWGERKNIPLQQYVEQGLFKLKKGTYTDPNGTIHTTTTVKVTGKGQEYFINKFLNNKK